MIRFAFFVLSAMLVVASVALWGGPDRSVPEPATSAPPEAAQSMAAAAERPAAPPAVVPPPPPAPEVTPAAEPAVPQTVPPGTVAEPALEEDVVDVASRPDFGEAGALADPWIEASVAEEDDADAPPAETEAAAQAAPVDVDASGDLVRRMLAVYEGMRD